MSNKRSGRRTLDVKFAKELELYIQNIMFNYYIIFFVLRTGLAKKQLEF